MRPKQTGLIVLATMLTVTALALPAAAHDLYLVTDGAGAQRKVCARVGEHFPDSMNAMPANRVHLFQVRRLTGNPRPGKKLAGVVEEAAKQLCAPLTNAASPGSPELRPYVDPDDVVEMTVNPVFIRLAAKDFNGYIEGEGFKEVMAARKDGGKADAEGRELYSRYSKLLLPGGKGATTPLGHVLEIVPEKSPDDFKPGETFTVTVLFRGKPLVGVRVSAVYAGAKLEGHAYPVNAETDLFGRARLKIDRPGLWYARLIHMVQAENDPDVDWRSFFATLTFSVPEK